MSMMSFFSALGKSSDTVDSTKAFTLLHNLVEGRYYLPSALEQNPIYKNNIIGIFTDGVEHVWEQSKKISAVKSTDRGITWGEKFTVWDPPNPTGAQDLSAGYSANARLHAFVTTQQSMSVTEVQKAMYGYSDDDGTTWSTWVELDSPADGLKAIRTYGNMIENNGVLMTPYYKFTGEGDYLSASAVYLYRSTDNGVTWNTITVKGVTSECLNEASIIALDNNTLIMVVRHETNKEWVQFQSNDNGLTWSRLGDVTFGFSISSANPVRMTSFNINNQKVIACWIPDRANDRLWVVYGKAIDLKNNGIAGWNLTTKTLVLQSDDSIHYGDICHYNNNFNARGMWPKDPNDGGGTMDEMLWFEVSATHYSTVKTALGI